MLAGEGEGIFMATFDLDKLRQYRSTTYWGNAYRRPDHYGPITSMDVAAPFKPRSNGFGEPFDRSQR